MSELKECRTAFEAWCRSEGLSVYDNGIAWDSWRESWNRRQPEAKPHYPNLCVNCRHDNRGKGLVPEPCKTCDSFGSKFENKTPEAKPCENCKRKPTCTDDDPCGPPAWESWDRRHPEAKALTVEDCVKLAAELQIISTNMLKTRNGKRYEEWMKEAIPIEQKAYAQAIHAALPPDQSARIAELEAELTLRKKAHSDLNAVAFSLLHERDQLQADLEEVKHSRRRWEELALANDKQAEMFHAQNKQLIADRDALLEQIK